MTTHELQHLPTPPRPAHLQPASHELHTSLARSEHTTLASQNLLRDTLSLIIQHPKETIGHSLIISTVTLGIHSVLQLFFQGTAVGSMVLGILSAGLHETLGMIVLFGGLGLSATLATLLSVGVNAIALGAHHMLWMRLLRRQQVGHHDMGYLLTRWRPLLLTSAITTLAILSGSALFIIPGILIALGTLFAPLIVLDHNMTATQSLKHSWRLTRGHRGQLLGLGALLTVANLLGLFTFGLGLFISIPLSIGCVVAAYNTLARPGLPAPQPAPLTLPS